MSTNCEPDTVSNFSKAAKNSSWPVGTAGVGRAHRECIDHAVIERLVAHGIGDGHRSRSVALRLCHHDVPEVDATALLRGPGDEALRVNGTAEVGVEVAALRHAMEERTRRRTIVARRFEGGRRDDGVEFARQHRQAQQDDEGRQEDDGKDDPTSQSLPRYARYSAKLERISVKWNQGVRRARSSGLPRLRGRGDRKRPIILRGPPWGAQ